MGALLMAILKNMAKAAVAGVKTVGKATLKAGKLGLEKNPLLQALDADKSNTAEALKGTAFDQSKYDGIQTPQTPPSWQQPQIPQQYAPMASSMQGPQVQPSGFSPQRLQPAIPPQYANMANQSNTPAQPQARPDVGYMRGMINALTGQPEPKGIGDVSQGRKTAYYAGGVIPNIIMSKLGQPSAAEATTRESQNQYYQTGSSLYDPITGELTGQKIPARSTAIKRETPSEQKYAKENDFTDSLKDWAGGVVDDDTAYKMMSENFPDKQKEIVQYYFLKTGRMPTR